MPVEPESTKLRSYPPGTRARNSTTTSQSFTIELIPNLCSFIGLSLGLISSCPHWINWKYGVFSINTNTSRWTTYLHFQPCCCHQYIHVYDLSLWSTNSTHASPTLPCWDKVWELGNMFSFSHCFALFLCFFLFLFVEPLFPHFLSESAPQELGYHPEWAKGTRLGVSLQLLLGERENLFPLGIVLHLMPLTIDETLGWSLVPLLPLLSTFLFPFAPSFLSLAISVLGCSSLNKHNLASSRWPKFPKNITQLPFLFSFARFSPSYLAPSLDYYKSTHCA